MDTNSLKQVMDNLVNEHENLFILIANKNKDSVNFLARSNSKINAGVVVKDASTRSGGNGGGSNKFAQGGGKKFDEISNIFKDLLDGKYND